MAGQFRQYPTAFPNLAWSGAEDGLQGFSVQGNNITWVQVR
ncbi:hypothetical protein TUM16653_46480 [Enterobacter cloacae]|nr:hypothetical protein TUM16653_46480 [Enterobacter cloacae]